MHFFKDETLESLQSMTDELDIIGWDIQDLIDEGNGISSSLDVEGIDAGIM